MKKLICVLCSLLFVMTAFGATSLFSGVIGATAAFHDYYGYTDLPGFNSFTTDEIKECYTVGAVFSDFSTNAYTGKTAANYTVNSLDGYGGATITSSNPVNIPANMNSKGEAIDFLWAAQKAPGGKTIIGSLDESISLEDYQGICFYVGHNGTPYNMQVKVQVFTVPTQGPFYKHSEEDELGLETYDSGFSYECPGLMPDENGYVYCDFKTDFNQADWWSVDDEGINRYGVKSAIPLKARKKINGISIRFPQVQVGDTITVSDMRAFWDKRLHPDELDELINIFSALNPDAYTEESYLAATEKYLEAYAVLIDFDKYTQKEIDAMSSSLREAIDALVPLFMMKEDSVRISGFEVWNNDDFEQMVEGGICLDIPTVDETVCPFNIEQSVLVMANAQDGPPTYGWSLFTNSVDSNGDIAVIKNPFALKRDSELLSTAAGIRFWIKWGDTFETAPYAMRVGVGSSESSVCFECEDSMITLPQTEGYIGIPWAAFLDIEGSEDIYDYIDDLDYISIYIEEAQGIYYIADLHGFCWDIAPADFTELLNKISSSETYMSKLDKNDWYSKSWNRVMAAIEEARSLIGAYGITEEDCYNAMAKIDSAINKLLPIGDLITIDHETELYNLIESGKTYWRGNVTSASYRDMHVTLLEAETKLDEGMKDAEGVQYINDLKNYISNLVPITGGEKVTSIFSFESYTNRDLSRATGERTEGVNYSLDKTNPKLPAGYTQAHKMTVTTDIGDHSKDELGKVQFNAMYRSGNNDAVPIKLGKNNENTLIGDLTGTDGICLWIGVNDINLIDRDTTMLFSAINVSKPPYFDTSATEIPIPATGSGWIYLPWEYFDSNCPWAAWAGGQPINLASIYFYTIRFEGAFKAGLELYATGIHAYKDVKSSTWEVPVVSNIAEGAEIDVSETPLVPEWNAGAAVLDNKYFYYGSSITQNGAHTLTVTNGDKKATVNFTVTGGVNADTVPVIVGADNGGEYEEPVTLTWDVGEATLNGEPVDSGVVVSEPGSYTLEVINGTKSATISFTIKEKAPEVNKGDYDNDGEITVTDALAALRIAAKLVPETDDDIAICDTDNDGHVTVTDALAILRVAAKLAPPESIGFRHTGGFDD